MNVAIVGGGLEYYNIVDAALQEMIEQKGVYLFSMLCGGPDTIGAVWATNNGIPYYIIQGKTPEQKQKNLLRESDFIIFLLSDSNQPLKNFMMEYKMTGKHGTVLKI